MKILTFLVCVGLRTDLIKSGDEDTGSGGSSAVGRSLKPSTPTKAWSGYTDLIVYKIEIK